MIPVSKKVAEEQIALFFQRTTFSAEEVRKIRRLAMAHNIKLKAYKARFCQNCLLPLHGSISVSRTHKTVVCGHCNHKNKIRIGS